MNAQSLQQGDVLPPIGATWHMRSLQEIPEMPVDEIPTVWPFATVYGNDVFGASFTMLDPGSVPVSAAYPGTDRVLRQLEDEDARLSHIFLDVQAQRCLALANNNALVSTVYSPGILVAAYPLVQGLPETGSYCSTSVSSTSLTPYCGESEILFVKTGLLQLHFGEFDEARLVRTRHTKVDQTDPSDSTMTETLTWFTPGFPYPLLQLVTVNYANGDQARSGHILDEFSVVGMLEAASFGTLKAYPNPSTGEVFLEAPFGGDLEILAADGRSIHVERVAASATPVRVDLGRQAAGIYHGILRRDGRSERFKLILE